MIVFKRKAIDKPAFPLDFLSAFSLRFAFLSQFSSHLRLIRFTKKRDLCTIKRQTYGWFKQSDFCVLLKILPELDAFSRYFTYCCDRVWNSMKGYKSAEKGKEPLLRRTKAMAFSGAYLYLFSLLHFFKDFSFPGCFSSFDDSMKHISCIIKLIAAG